MQGRAPDDVLYIGTASKSLAPGLRIAWAVVPPRFLEAFLAARRWHRTVASLDQRVLAELLDDGSFERHLRRCRALYRRRRDDVVAGLAVSTWGSTSSEWLRACTLSSPSRPRDRTKRPFGTKRSASR